MISELRRKFREFQDTKNSKKELDKITMMMDSIVYKNIVEKNSIYSNIPFNPFKDSNTFGNRTVLNNHYFIELISTNNGNIFSLKNTKGQSIFAYADQRKIGKIIHDYNTVKPDDIKTVIEIIQPYYDAHFNIEEKQKYYEDIKEKQNDIINNIKNKIKSNDSYEYENDKLVLSIKNRNIIKEIFIKDKNSEEIFLRAELKIKKGSYKIIKSNHNKIDEVYNFIIPKKSILPKIKI